MYVKVSDACDAHNVCDAQSDVCDAHSDVCDVHSDMHIHVHLCKWQVVDPESF